PEVNLPEPVRGQKAVQALGTHLSDVAKAYGLSAAELQSLFTSDQTLAVDRKGRLHYVEPTVDAAQAAAATTEPAVQAALAPLADTFLLHSRAGAKRIIYLDFN